MIYVSWLQLDNQLPSHLLDYPANLPLESIAASLLQINVCVRVVSLQEALDSCAHGPGVFLFSATTPEWPKTVQAASHLRGHSPESLFIVGGYHVSATPHAPGTELFDYVVVGEGEGVLRSILAPLSLVRTEQAPRRTASRVVLAQRITDLDRLQMPLRDEREVRANRLRGLMFPAPSAQTGTAALLLSRGCNNECTFCASHTVWGSQLFTRGINNIVQEIEHVTNSLGANALVFVDQAFGEDTMWARDLCYRLQGTLKGHAKWYCMAKASLEPSLLSDMAIAGCTKIGFGVETAGTRERLVLKRMGPWEIDELNRLFRSCNDHGILVKAYFMIGFPWETEHYLSSHTLDFLANLQANELKITYFTPFPGTEDWEHYSGHLLTTDWEKFDTETMPVVYNPNITVERYRTIRQELFRAFYGSRMYSETTHQLLNIRPHYTQSYIEFADFLKARDMISGNEVWLQSFRHCTPDAKVTEVA